MRVLVTGCAGFIGWKVSEFAVRAAHEVIGIDNLNDAYDISLKEWRLSQLRDLPQFRFRRVDVGDRGEVSRLFEESHFDAVINLAARAGVRQSLMDPWVYYQTNVIGTLNLLEACKARGVRKFVLASTSGLYAGCPLPFREEQPTDRCLSPYAASKKAAEALCHSYAYLYGIDVTVLRYFTVYGPAGRPDMSLFRFVQRIFENRPVVVYGDGGQSRDFTFVDDIATGTLAALQPAGYEIINLGSDRPVILMDAIHLIEDLAGKHAAIKYEAAHPADIPATWAHVDKAKSLLRWEPRFPIEEGLMRLTSWYQQNRQWAKDVDTG